MMRWMIVLVLMSACGGKKDEAAPVRSGSGSGSGSATVAVAPPVDATGGLAAKIKAARCGEPCLFLVDTPFDKLLDTYKAECAGMETKDAGFTDCKQLDYMRMCIYAAHGTVDKKGKYKKKFGDKPWYEPHPEFEPKTISELERANVHELYERGKACKKGLHISGADYDRIKAWFAALPATPPGTPKLIWKDDEQIEPDALAKFMMDEFAVGKKTVVLDSTFAADYYESTAFLPDAMVEATKNMKNTRMIQVYTSSSPYAVHFVYDDKDQLVAIGAVFVQDGE